MEIGEFIAARLAEEEADARAATPGPWTSGETPFDSFQIYGPDGRSLMYDAEGLGTSDARHIVRQNPKVADARVAALRALVETCMTTRWRCDGFDASEAAVTHVAAIWSWHPDYRAEWAA